MRLTPTRRSPVPPRGPARWWPLALPAAVALVAGCGNTITGTAAAELSDRAHAETAAAQPLTQPGLVSPALPQHPPAGSTTDATTTLPSAIAAAPAQPEAPPVPATYSPEAQHICVEIQQSRLAPDQYRAYLEHQPSYAWMSPRDKVELAAGIQMAETGSCD
jgi:hypothetical protein